jgi:hypothetical protein
MAGSVSHTHVRSMFSLEREIEIDYIHHQTKTRANKRPQPLPPQPDLSTKDNPELSSNHVDSDNLNLLQFPNNSDTRSN